MSDDFRGADLTLTDVALQYGITDKNLLFLQ